MCFETTWWSVQAESTVPPKERSPRQKSKGRHSSGWLLESLESSTLDPVQLFHGRTNLNKFRILSQASTHTERAMWGLNDWPKTPKLVKISSEQNFGQGNVNCNRRSRDEMSMTRLKSHPAVSALKAKKPLPKFSKPKKPIKVVAKPPAIWVLYQALCGHTASWNVLQAAKKWPEKKKSDRT